jgi:hypothetical protein
MHMILILFLFPHEYSIFPFLKERMKTGGWMHMLLQRRVFNLWLRHFVMVCTMDVILFVYVFDLKQHNHISIFILSSTDML